MNRLRRYAHTALTWFYETRYRWLGIPAPRLKAPRSYWVERGRDWLDAVAAAPESVRADNARMNQVFVDELGTHGFSRLLDLGCGYGERLKPVMVAYPDQRYVGIDLSPTMLANARRYLAGLPRLTLLEVNGSHLPFTDGTFDAAITWGTLEAIPPEGMRLALAELRRVVRGPIVAIEEEGHGDWDERRWSDERALARWFFPYDFEAEFRAAGFTIRRRYALTDLNEIRPTVYVLESR